MTHSHPKLTGRRRSWRRQRNFLRNAWWLGTGMPEKWRIPLVHGQNLRSQTVQASHKCNGARPTQRWFGVKLDVLNEEKLIVTWPLRGFLSCPIFFLGLGAGEMESGACPYALRKTTTLRCVGVDGAENVWPDAGKVQVGIWMHFFDRKRPTKMMMSCGNTTKTLVFEFAYTFTYIYIDAKYTVCTVYLYGIYIYRYI